ncbi:glycosyltransferase [Calycomorphotria hydatis]|uniref:glycosyltransferase n=1 Tax=Calycomorphotria hydatis TaxID=2528027 RepID=UPI0018D1FB95|nr:glycosyltransferase [Calycomorphotria hydatis]
MSFVCYLADLFVYGAPSTNEGVSAFQQNYIQMANPQIQTSSLRPESCERSTFSTGAVVVTFYPGPDIDENLAKIASQIEQIVVVDNGSPVDDIERLQKILGRIPKGRLIENGSNLGIAAALNIGAREIISLGCNTILYFDQDSRVDNNLVECLQQHLIKGGSRVGLVAAKYRDGLTGKPCIPEGGRQRDQFYFIERIITSGTMMRSETYEQVGPFREDFFIDAVDHEYNSRIVRCGYTLGMTENTLMEHSIGNTGIVQVGEKEVRTSNHSALRRYYMLRNGMTLTMEMLRYSPSLACTYGRHVLYNQIHAMRYEKKSRKKFVVAYFYAIMHAAVGKLGPASESLLCQLTE